MFISEIYQYLGTGLLNMRRWKRSVTEEAPGICLGNKVNDEGTNSQREASLSCRLRTIVFIPL